MNTDTDNTLARLSKRAQTTLTILLRSGIADKAIAEVEARDVTRRRALLAELTALDASQSSTQSTADAAASASARELEKAEAAYERAKTAHRQVMDECGGTAYGFTRQRRRITDELLSSADTRLADFAFHLNQLDQNDVRHALIAWINDAAPRGLLGSRWLTNTGEVAPARAACAAVLQQVRDAQMQALSHAEVSSALKRWCAELAPGLAVLQLNPPALRGSDLEPMAPLRWGSGNRWLADEETDPRLVALAQKEDRRTKMRKA